MSRYRHLIFDLDGTLVDSYQALTTALNRAGNGHLRSPFTPESVKTLVGEGVERLLERAFSIASVPPEIVSAFERSYDEVCCDESRILDEVELTLEVIAGHGISMAVCTNKPTFFSRKILDHLGLSHFFAAIVGPDLAGARKPDPRHVQAALDSMGGTSAEALFVGDMPIDVEAARASGIAVAAVPTGSVSAEVLRNSGPDYMLARFSDLLDLLQSGNRA